MIRHCRLWLLGAVVLALTTATSLLMAGLSQRNGEADSLPTALLTVPASSSTRAARQQLTPGRTDIDAVVAAAVPAALFIAGTADPVARMISAQPPARGPGQP